MEEILRTEFSTALNTCNKNFMLELERLNQVFKLANYFIINYK